MKVSNWDREILQLAVPSIVTNVTVPLLGLVDLAIVGHIGNETMIGAIAVGSMMTANASTQKEVLRRYIRLALLIAGCFLLLQVPLRWLSIWLMGPTDEVAAYVRTYFNICIWGAPAVLSLYVMTGWFIGMRDTRTPMVVSITQNLINIVASLVLVFGFGMQIKGVALGTLIAQWSGAAMAWGKVNSTRLSLQPLPDREELGGESAGGGPASFFQTNRDLFLRTVCLVAVNLFFTSAGASQGDLLLSVNTLLMTFFTLFSYVMDGFANAGEALCGSRTTPKEKSREIVVGLFRWGWLMVLLFTVVYALGGRHFLLLLTDEAYIVDAAMTFLPWALLIPVSGMAAFVYDGIFVGKLLTRGMLISCSIATAAFFVLYFLLFPLMGNHALWLALIVYLALRGLVQHVYLVKSKE